MFKFRPLSRTRNNGGGEHGRRCLVVRLAVRRPVGPRSDARRVRHALPRLLWLLLVGLLCFRWGGAYASRCCSHRGTSVRRTAWPLRPCYLHCPSCDVVLCLVGPCDIGALSRCCGRVRDRRIPPWDLEGDVNRIHDRLRRPYVSARRP